MKRLIHYSTAIVAVVLALQAAALASSTDREREKLLSTQKTLSTKIEMLKQEQDFLLFEKTAFSQDSKYLIVNIAGKTGQLKYKARVLKDFSFLPQSRHLDRLKRGFLPLTLKIEDPRKKNGMVFGNVLLVFAKGKEPGGEAGLARLVLTRKDFRALFYALEKGAMLYVFP